jgi:uncharacterized membrane protein
MKYLTKLTTSGLFTSAIIFASQVNAAGWGEDSEYQPDNVSTDFEGSVMDIMNYILGFITIVATLMIIYGGVLYLTSAGNEDTASRAKKTIAFGVIGLVVIGLAYALVNLITNTVLSGGGSGE